MHLQQTKRASLKSGGPQYYFHDLTDPVKVYLRHVGAVAVALVTPYGATKSSYFAVGKDHKIDENGIVRSGKVGHDRIQQGGSSESIGESIRWWYGLPKGEFERIDLDVQIIEERFYVSPLRCKYANSTRWITVERHHDPLTFTEQYQSPLWRRQIRQVSGTNLELLRWSLSEISRVASVHKQGSKVAHVQEQDILRASGPLGHLGVILGPYVGKGYDCVTDFAFLKFPTYRVPVEIKRESKDFHYQQSKYGKEELSRAVVLCATHNLRHVPANIDVLDLSVLGSYLKNI